MTTIAGRYELLDQLGAGGMATVWRAQDQRLHRLVAVKLLSPTLAADPGFQARFEREAHHAASLNHPNVVTIFDFGTNEGRPYLVMELVDGESLSTLLQRVGTIDIVTTHHIGTGILAGLAEAHRNGIVHRDVKPSNVLLGRSGAVKVADFGVALAMSDTTKLTDTGLLLGTASYLSPEQGAGHPAGPPSDLYSAGCVLYQCLTGRPPFWGESVASVIYQHQHAVPVPIHELRPDVPPAVEAAVMRSLAKEPDGRFPSAADMNVALRDGSAVERTPVGATERIQRTAVMGTPAGPVQRPPRDRMWWVAGVVALALIALLIATLLITNPFSAASHRPPLASKSHSSVTTTTSGTSIAATTSPPTTTPPALASVDLSVVNCPATGPGAATTTSTLPSTMTVTITSSTGVSASNMAIYATSNGRLAMMAPISWSCSASFGEDGSGGLAVVNTPDTDVPDVFTMRGSTFPEAITARTTGACAGCTDTTLCPFFSSVHSIINTRTCSTPTGETTGLLSADVAYFDDPPGVSGTGRPSGGTSPANGVVIDASRRPGTTQSYVATCTLPQSEHSLCTAVLDDFTRRYQTK